MVTDPMKRGIKGRVWAVAGDEEREISFVSSTFTSGTDSV